MPAEAKDFDAGTFDKEIYECVTPYSNTLSDLDGVVYGEDYKRIGKNAAWVKFAGIYGNGTVEEDGALLGHIFAVIGKLAKEQGLDNGYRVISNVGEDAGQTVKHLHFHVLGGEKLPV